jgi:TetR/AcrR family transcriptional regulator
MKRRDPEATRNAILEAAEQVFSEKGFAETATSELARRAGVTKSLIHHHFGSKEGLWDAIKQREFGVYHAAQSEMLDRPFTPDIDVLIESVEVYFRFLQSRPRFARMLTWMHLEDDESCRVMGADLFAKGVERLVDGQNKGLIRADVRPESILMSFFGLVEHWFLARNMMPHLPDDQAVGDEQYLADILKIFARGVAGPVVQTAGENAPSADPDRGSSAYDHSNPDSPTS